MAFQYGEEQVAFGVAESTYGVATVPAATDGFRISDFTITPAYDRPEVPETRATRSLQETITGRKSAGWSINLINRPSGTAGTPPDYHLLLKHAFGSYTNNASTSDVYTPLKDPSGLSLALYRQLEGIQEGVYGAVVQNATFNWSGDGFSTVAFSGIAKDMSWAGTDQTNGTGSGATTLVVDKGDMYGKYGVVDINGDGSAVLISAVSGNNLTIPSDTWGDNEAVAPYMPTATLAGDPLYGTAGSLSLDGGSSTISHVSGSLALATGIDLYARDFGTSTPTAVTLPQRRSVSGNFSFLVEDNGNYETLRGKAANATAQDVQLNIGTTSGSICRIECPKAELSASPISGGTGLIEMSLSFTALTSTTSATEDEVTVTYL